MGKPSDHIGRGSIGSAVDRLAAAAQGHKPAGAHKLGAVHKLGAGADIHRPIHVPEGMLIHLGHDSCTVREYSVQHAEDLRARCTDPYIPCNFCQDWNNIHYSGCPLRLPWATLPNRR